MSKNITIQEGGTPRNFTASKIKTGLNDGGTDFQYWIPENEMNLGTKTITENGTYTASDEDLTGYSQIIVNVEGGGGGSTNFFARPDSLVSEADTILVDGVGDRFPYKKRNDGLAAFCILDNTSDSFDGWLHVVGVSLMANTSSIDGFDELSSDYTYTAGNITYYFAFCGLNSVYGGLASYTNPLNLPVLVDPRFNGGFQSLSDEDCEVILDFLKVAKGGFDTLLQSKTITSNGVHVPDSGYDGFSQVIVNVKDENNFIVGDSDTPSNDLGEDGDIYICKKSSGEFGKSQNSKISSMIAGQNSNTANKLIDGDTTTFWTTNDHNYTNTWFGAIFNEPVPINQLRIKPRVWNRNVQASNCTFQGSNDGVTWTDITSFTFENDHVDDWRTFSFSNNNSYTQYRVYGNPGSGGFNGSVTFTIYEVEFYTVVSLNTYFVGSAFCKKDGIWIKTT